MSEPIYRIRKTSYRCSDCKFQFDKLRKFSLKKYPYDVGLPLPKKNPDCPKCNSGEKINFKSSVTDDTHPYINPERPEHSEAYRGGTSDNPAKAFSMGKSNFTVAMDATADIVMKDYGLTNLQDNLREGDTMVPKLAPELERKVDGVFKTQKSVANQQAALALNQSLTRQINSGAFRGYGGASDVVARQQQSGIKPQTNIILEHGRGKPN